MSAEGLELYARGEQAWARREVHQAAALLEKACCQLPAHGAAHHLLGKVIAELGDAPRAEALQQRSCELDPGLGWNWFALAELQEKQLEWGKAAENYRRALVVLPQEGWIEELAIRSGQRQLLRGEDLSKGLGPNAYRHWCEQLEPRLPSELVPVHQKWWIHSYGENNSGHPPVQGWLIVLGPGCVLRPRAVQGLEAWIASFANEYQPDLITADEDSLDVHGRRCDPWFKPDSLFESFWAQPWLQTISIWRCSWLRAHSLILPPASSEKRIAWLWEALALKPQHAHMPAVLMHRKFGSSESQIARQAEARHIANYLGSEEKSIVYVRPHPKRESGFRIDWAVPHGLRCSVIVPTRNHAELLSRCMASVESSLKNNSTQLDWIVVDNNSDEEELFLVLAEWRRKLGNRLSVIRDNSPFNWSHLNNIAAKKSDAELLLFLNNDTEAISPGWLDKMSAQAIRPAIGCVGAKLLYPDGTFQHTGLGIGIGHGSEHVYRSLSENHDVHRGRAGLLSDWGGVTGAALMIKRSLFERFGGFDPQLPVEFNDVDLCLRLGQHGFRHVIDPDVVLLHRECQSRDPAASNTFMPAKQLMHSRWSNRLRCTAPWWPQACSELYADGRPRELDVVC